MYVMHTASDELVYGQLKVSCQLKQATSTPWAPLIGVSQVAKVHDLAVENVELLTFCKARNAQH